MTKLCDVPPKFIELFEVVETVIQVWVVDVQFVWINSNDWTYTTLMSCGTVPFDSLVIDIPYCSCIFWISQGYLPLLTI